MAIGEVGEFSSLALGNNPGDPSDRARLFYNGAQQLLTDGALSVQGLFTVGSPTTAANLIVNGNVGIGTPSPLTARLEVLGTVKASLFQGDGSGLTGLQIPNSSIGNVKLADNAVTATKLQSHPTDNTQRAVSKQHIQTGSIAIAQLSATLVAEGMISVSDSATVLIQNTKGNEHAFYLVSVTGVSTSSTETGFPIDFSWKLQTTSFPIRRPPSFPSSPTLIGGNRNYLIISSELAKSVGVSITVAYKVYRLNET